MERHAGSYKKDDNYINGMPEYTVEIKEHIPVNDMMIAILSPMNIECVFLKQIILICSYRRVQW